MKKLILTVIALVALGAVACQNKNQDAPFENQNVAVILRSATDTIGLQIANGIIGASMQYSVFPDLFYADSMDDYQGQIEIIESLDPTQYIGYIIIPAADNSQMRSIVTQLSQVAPVVVAQTALSGDLPVLSFVGTDNLAAGESLAVQANKTLSAGDTLFVIQTSETDNIKARLLGFGSRIEAMGHPSYWINVKGISQVDYLTEGLLESNPGTKAIITSDAESSVIVAAKLQQLDRGDVMVFTFDIPSSVATQIENGNIEGTMASDTYHIGYNAIKAIVDNSVNITPARTQYQPTMYIDQNNIESAEASVYINKI